MNAPPPDKSSNRPRPVVTVRDVARAAGVSKTTASDALRGDRRVAAATRDLVQAAARQVGYHASASISGAAARHFRDRVHYYKVLVLLVGSDPRKPPRMGNVSFLLRPVQVERGLSFGFDSVPALPQLMRRLDRAYAEGYEGVVLGTCPFEESGKRAVAEALHQFSVVSIGGVAGEEYLPFHTVHQNYLSDVQLAFVKARASGSRRIGFALFSHDPELLDDRVRHAAALECLSRLPVGEAVPVLIQRQGTSPAESRATLLDWVSTNRVDCVVSFLITNYHLLRDAGLRVPADIRFIALRLDPDYAEYGQVAGLSRNFDGNMHAVSSTILELLRLRERGPAEHPRLTLVRSAWLPGCSLPEPLGPAPRGN